MASNLPDYVAAAKPVPKANRTAWFLSTAPTYAGIMLWFVFWQDVPVGSGITPAKGQFSEFAGGVLSHGLLVAFVGLILAALLCHFLFYLVPGLLGLKTGLPLYIVGTSTYGVQGGFLMPGFLMGLLQFGWLGVNSFFAGLLLCAPFGYGALTVPHALVSTLWAVAAALMGLKGIQYVARVATFFPLIPLSILVILFLSSVAGLGSFNPDELADAGAAKVVEVKESEFKQQRGSEEALSSETGGDVKTTTYQAQLVEVEKSKTFVTKRALSAFGVIALICTYIVGFFATAGAAGTDFGMNNRNAKDVQLGGLVGIALATVISGGLALLIVAGAQGKAAEAERQEVHPVALAAAEEGAAKETYRLALADVVLAAEKAAENKTKDKKFRKSDLEGVQAAAKEVLKKKDAKIDRAALSKVLAAAQKAAAEETADQPAVDPGAADRQLDPAVLAAVLVAARKTADEETCLVLNEILADDAWRDDGGAGGITVTPAVLAAAEEAAGDKIDAAILPAALAAANEAQGKRLDPSVLRGSAVMESLLGGKMAGIFMYLLAIAAFPPACFSSFIAANSFKTTLPRVNPFLSVGCGTAVAVLLAVSGLAGDVMGMFVVIGASFGPVCGAMAADYLLAGRKWAGPRAGFNLAGWISWGVGFLVGIDMIPGLAGNVPCPPMAAFIVGFGLYAVLAMAGLEGKTLEMPEASEETAS